MSKVFDCEIKVGERGSASFSECRSYRYMLERRWDITKETVNFVMLNPSTADQDQDDPTIRRCIGYAKLWGFGGLFITNIFALRSTDPTVLYGHADPIGPDNDAHIAEWASVCAVVVCAWGKHGDFKARGDAVRKILPTTHRVALKILGDQKTPGHPLYLKSDLQPIKF